MGLISLKELREKFSSPERRVYIPLYQRNYKWPARSKKKGDISAQNLAYDLLGHYKESRNKDYLLGMVTVYVLNKGDIQILDGQQRMITLSLLMKCLGKANAEEWFDLQFERDKGFTILGKDTPRHDYIYSEHSGGIVDVVRMRSNYEAIREVVEGLAAAAVKEDFYQFVMEHVKVLYRETDREPVEEFLNMNFNKTPFCAADYIKSYMVLDASEEDARKTISDVIDLWKRLENIIFRLNGSDKLENDMFQLVKQNYTTSFLDKNRMEMLFEDRYISEKKPNEERKLQHRKYFDKKAAIDSLQREYEKLEYYYLVMKNVLEEIRVVDANGKIHPNYNAYSAYNLLCKKVKDIHFFRMLDEYNENKRQGLEQDALKIIRERFNLTETAHKKVNRRNDVNARNQFMEAMLVSAATTERKLPEDISNKDYLKKRFANTYENLVTFYQDEVNFDSCYDIFNECFREYIDIMEKGKSYKEWEEEAEKANSYTENSEMVENTQLKQGKSVLRDLLFDDRIKAIKIPIIQRDYVMGSSGEYLEVYLMELYFAYVKSLVECEEPEKSEEVLSYWSVKNREYVSVNVDELFYRMVLLRDSKKLYKGSKAHMIYNPIREETPRCKTDKTGDFDMLQRYMENLDFSMDKPDRYVLDDLAYETYNTFRKNLYERFQRKMQQLEERTQKYSKRYVDEDVKNKFNSSCVMGHLDDNGVFWVYDGQQRVTTSIVLLAYLLRHCKSEEDEVLKRKLRDNLKKFSFAGRDGANECLELLLADDGKNDLELKAGLREKIDDKTSYSIYKLVESYQKYSNEGILVPLFEPNFVRLHYKILLSINYILNGIEYELVPITSVSDAEQLFMELNEGLQLEFYEKYKAEFNYIVSQTLTDEELKKDIFLKLDNEWLNAFGGEKDAEQGEIAVLQYCVTMAYFERKGYAAKRSWDSLAELDEEILLLAKESMERIIDFKAVESREESLEKILRNCAGLEEKIIYWMELFCSNKPDKAWISVLNGKRYFGKDFRSFVQSYFKFAQGSGDGYRKVFEMINEFRAHGYLEIPEEFSTEECKQAETLYVMMLNNQKNQFEYKETEKWEKRYSDYWKVQNSKDESYVLSKYEKESGSARSIISLDHINNEILPYESIFEKICAKTEYVSNYLKYYAEEKTNKKMSVVIRFHVNDMIRQWMESTEDLFRDIEKCQEGVNLKNLVCKKYNRSYVSAIMEVEIETDLHKFVDFCIEEKRSELITVGIDKGLWYMKDGKLNYLSGGNESRYTKYLQERMYLEEIELHAIAEDITNNLINMGVCGSKDYDDLDKLLKHYKNADEKVEKSFQCYIMRLYYDFITEKGEVKEDLYYIAKKYLKAAQDERQKYFGKYLKDFHTMAEKEKAACRGLFLYEDFAGKGESKEEIKYILTSGMGALEECGVEETILLKYVKCSNENKPAWVSGIRISKQDICTCIREINEGLQDVTDGAIYDFINNAVQK